MANIHIQFIAKTLGMATSLRVILPEEGDLSACKVVYLLHGLSDDSTGWMRYTSCERYARERGIALVLPEVQRSFYTDAVFGLPYFQYISEELPQVAHRFFGLSLAREQQYIFGLSMGGYGALKCAFTAPEQYAGCASFSGVVDIASYLKTSHAALTQGEATAIFGPERTVLPRNDLFRLAERVTAFPGVYLSCGEEDSFYSMNTAFSAYLTKRNCPHRYDHRPGDHNWAFWEQSLLDAFAYFFDA